MVKTNQSQATTALEEMLKLVAEQQRKACESIHARAQQEVQELIQSAHRAARRRMHDNVAEIRQLMRREQNQARAALETAKRQHQQRCDFAVLESGWPRLRAALMRRWQDAALRRRWCDALIAQARATLPRGPWQVYHPADVSEAERIHLAQALASASGAPAHCHASDKLSAGLKLCCEGACLDGTLDGSLRDRAAIQAQLLAKLDG
jgi:F0F1-type ATP synthase membrane subunit b/b'